LAPQTFKDTNDANEDANDANYLNDKSVKIV
jgi:hypothetical protein